MVLKAVYKYRLESPARRACRNAAATVGIVDIPGLARGANKGEGVGNSFLADIRTSDALIHVLRCFDDEELAHIEGSVDPVRDIETINLELQVKDLEAVEKKIAFYKEHDSVNYTRMRERAYKRVRMRGGPIWRDGLNAGALGVFNTVTY